LLQGRHAPHRQQRVRVGAAGWRRRHHRARRRRGDDEAARHRLPPEPARGLAACDPRAPAPDAARLRPRAVHRSVVESVRADRDRTVGRVCMRVHSTAVGQMLKYLEPVLAQVSDLALERRATQPDACDFRFGNPQEMPLPQIQAAITKWAAPKNKDWFAYKFNDPSAVKVAVESLKRRVGIDFDPADIAMTTGAFGALATSLRAILDPGDEVIYLSPPWFFYVPMILSCGATPVRVDFSPPAFELPVDAIEWHIT